MVNGRIVSPFLQFARAVRGVVRVQRRLRGPLRPSWDENFETLATILHHYGKRSTHLPLGAQRRAAQAILPRSRVVAETQFEAVSAGGVEAEWFRREDSDESRVLVYLHGGGYSIGSLNTHRDLISRLARASGALTLGVEYRLAPEHRFPAQLDDAVTVYDWLLERGYDPKRIVIAGESAGGGLTVSTLVQLRDTGRPLPAGAVCISPWVDLEATGASMRTNRRFDYVDRNVIRTFAKRFVEPSQLTHPLAAPLHAELHGLPPLLIQAGGAETLLDDSVRLAERAEAAGIDVELEIGEDMIHAWHLFAAGFDECKRAVRRAGAFTAQCVLGSDAPEAEGYLEHEAAHAGPHASENQRSGFS